MGSSGWTGRVRHLLTRAAIGFVFVSFGVWELVDSQYWTAFVPSFVSAAAARPLVLVHGAVLFVLGAAVLLGCWLRWSAFLASVMLVEVSVGLLVSSGFSDLVVRDVGLLFLAVSMVFDEERYFCVTR